jgi:ribosomal protein L37AE/L43A
MDLNFKKIWDAWLISYRPTNEQILLAQKRNEICETCPSRKEIARKIKIGVVCSECGCPIAKKIFTNTFNDCPLKKWENVDSKYFPKSKDSKSII